VFALHAPGPGAPTRCQPESLERDAVVGQELLADDVKSEMSFCAPMFAWNTDATMNMGPLGTYRMSDKDGHTGRRHDFRPMITTMCQFDGDRVTLAKGFCKAPAEQ
jgi:hypothetical protein